MCTRTHVQSPCKKHQNEQKRRRVRRHEQSCSQMTTLHRQDCLNIGVTRFLCQLQSCEIPAVSERWIGGMREQELHGFHVSPVHCHHERGHVMQVVQVAGRQVGLHTEPVCDRGARADHVQRVSSAN